MNVNIRFVKHYDYKGINYTYSDEQKVNTSKFEG